MVRVPYDVQMVDPLAMTPLPPSMVDPLSYNDFDVPMTLDRDSLHDSYPSVCNSLKLPTNKNCVPSSSRQGYFSHHH